MIGVTSFSNNGQSFRPHMGPENHHWNPSQRREKAEGKSWLFPKLCLQIPALEEAVGRKKCDRKLTTTERDDRSLERIVRSNCFNNLVEITRECQEHGVTVSRATIYRRLQEMGSRTPVTKPLLSSRQKRKCLVWSTERRNWTATRWVKSAVHGWN